jgi:uncharacterized SAM-binding protein YcdF (DUF218 family)
MSQPYDALIILGGGLRKEGSEYYPATYQENDGFGMLGGHMRLQAAIDLFHAKASPCFLFTTGVYEKNKTRLGADVPPESEVYAARFKEALAGEPLPEILVETASSTTLTDLIEAIREAKKHGWHRIAVVSSDYHIPRVRALYEHVLAAQSDTQFEAEFLSAEKTVQEFQPGVFDREITEAYASDGARERQQNEQRGLQDLRDGKYATKEFQLKRL